MKSNDPSAENLSEEPSQARPPSIRTIAHGLTDVAYYLAQVESGAMEIDAGFLERARAFTEDYLVRAQAWLDQRSHQTDDPSGAYVQAHHRGKVAALLHRVRDPNLALGSLHEIAETARELVHLLSLAGGNGFDLLSADQHDLEY